MREVSKDADMRHRDKMVRREKMETFKKQAAWAFGRGEYEKALNYYNKVTLLKIILELDSKELGANVRLKILEPEYVKIAGKQMNLNNDSCVIIGAF